MRLSMIILMGLMVLSTVSAQAMQHDAAEEPRSARKLTPEQMHVCAIAGSVYGEMCAGVHEETLRQSGLTMADYDQYTQQREEENRSSPQAVIHAPRGEIVSREDWDVDPRFERVTYANGEKSLRSKPVAVQASDIIASER